MKTKFLMIAITFFYSLSSMANSYVQNTYITSVDTRNDGTFLITVSGNIVNSPACATEKNRMSGNANSVGGKVLLANAMSAFTKKKTVEIQGSEVCNEYPGIQSVFRLVQFQ